MHNMNVLGIESTCDETACAVVVNGRTILSNVVFSQIDVHKQYGGVFPEIASRMHVDSILPVIKEALKRAQLAAHEIDLIAVANAPGLIGPLLIGLSAAKALALAWNRPLIGVNHVEAHLYASMMEQTEWLFPAIGLVLSGGHSFLVKIDALGSYTPIGSTVDDALGEAFDKVASLLGLSYPGGPALEALAREGDASRFRFSAGKVKGREWDFSFSGIKTSVLYTLKGANGKKEDSLKIPQNERAHVAAAFQECVLCDVVEKALKAAKQFDCKALYLGGGVTNNKRLRALFEEKREALPVFFPSPALSLDNGAMIAGLAYHLYQRQGCSDPLSLEPKTRLPLAPVSQETQLV